ncbi:Uncharacterised protein [Serratia quinivorans]|nr:Uncharacterised protein [Serratia quinivorans]
MELGIALIDEQYMGARRYVIAANRYSIQSISILEL